MSPSEYQELVEFLGSQFAAIDRRFTASDQRFMAADQRLGRPEGAFREFRAEFRDFRGELAGHFDEIYRRFVGACRDLRARRAPSSPHVTLGEGETP